MASITRAAMETSSPLAYTTFDEGSVIGFKDSQAGVEQVALGNDNDIKARGDLVATKNLSYQSFSTVSLHRSTELFRGRDPQPADAVLVGEDEHRGVPAVKPCAAVVNLLELRTAAYVLGGAKPQIELFAADRQPLAAFGAAALQDKTAVFGAHPHQKTVRLLAMTRIGLERALALHDIPSGENEPPMLANAFQGCQSDESVLEFASFTGPFRP